MAKKKSEILSLEEIKRVSKKMDETEQYEVTKGQFKGKTITFYPIFDYVKIKELIREYQYLLLQAEDKGIEFDIEKSDGIISMLVIKHFTHFKKDIPNELLGTEDGVPGFLDYYEHFVKTGLLEECIEEMFLPSEIKKVVDAFAEILGKSYLIDEIEKLAQQKIERLKIKNKEVLNEFAKQKIKPNKK